MTAPASLSGSIKALIEAGNLSLSAYRDDTGKGTPAAKYVTIDEGIVITTDRLSGDSNTADPVTELVQVNLWQPFKAKQSGDPAEDYSLANRLVALLDKATLPTPPMAVRSCTVDSVVRLVDADDNTVHHAITVRLRRERV